MILPCKIRFADEKVKAAFEELKNSTTEYNQLGRKFGYNQFLINSPVILSGKSSTHYKVF